MKTRKNVIKSRRNRRKSAKSRCRKHRYTLRGGLSDKPGFAISIPGTIIKYRSKARREHEAKKKNEDAAAAAAAAAVKKKEAEKQHRDVMAFLDEMAKEWARRDEEIEDAKPEGVGYKYSPRERYMLYQLYGTHDYDAVAPLYLAEQKRKDRIAYMQSLPVHDNHNSD